MTDLTPLVMACGYMIMYDNIIDLQKQLSKELLGSFFLNITC